jgi:DNA-binding PadR family transcriptional regulator
MHHQHHGRRDGSPRGGHGGGHDGSHDRSSRHLADRRFARDPLDTDDRFGGRHRFILLSMIAARPAHGYDLIKALEERMGGGYSPSPGVIYPTLTLLEEQGLANVTAEDGKKLYRATPDGEAFLQANRTTVDAIQVRIDGIARERGVVPDPRIIRAIENLKTALRLRLGGGPIADEQVRAIAAAIDAAAAEAERA